MNTEYTYRDDLNTKSGDYAEYAKVKDYIMCTLDVPYLSVSCFQSIIDTPDVDDII